MSDPPVVLTGSNLNASFVCALGSHVPKKNNDVGVAENSCVMGNRTEEI